MRTVRPIGLVVTAVCVWLISTSLSVAGVVELTDGATREGQVIVRENVVTIVTSENRLFQFYLEKVGKITTKDPKKHLLGADVELKTEPKQEAGSAARLSKGIEVNELERQENWVKVKAVRETEVGWVSQDVLVKEVAFQTETQQQQDQVPPMPAAQQQESATDAVDASQEPEPVTAEQKAVSE